MNETQAQRLNDARLCVLTAKKFSMDEFVHPCGTPACVLGNYAAWSGQSRFRIFDGEIQSCADQSLWVIKPSVEEFGIDDGREWAELFERTGCNNAKTPQQAADYIAAFLVRKNFGHLVVDTFSTEPAETLASAAADELLPTVYPVRADEVAWAVE